MDPSRQHPRTFNYGPYKLNTIPPGTNISFRPKDPNVIQSLKPEQKCLMDNLWASRAQNYFVDIVQALGYYFTWVNTTMSQKTQELALIQTYKMGKLDFVTPAHFKPMPVLTQENERLKASLYEAQQRIQLLEKQNVELTLKVQEKGAYEQEAEKFLKKEFKERRDKMILLPETLWEVSKKIQMHVHGEKLAEIMMIQEWLREQIANIDSIPDGFSFSIINQTK